MKMKFVIIRYLNVTRSLRAWPRNSCSRDAFVGFWKYDVIVPSVRVHSRVPSFKEKSLIHWQFFEISARLKLVSVPFNSLLLDIGHLKKSSPCWKRGLQERCLPTRREATNFQIPNACSALDKSRFLIYAKSRHMRAHFWHAKTVSKEHTTSKNRPK